MPEFTTHYLFGKSVLEDFPPEITEIIKSDMSAFNWGLQGPDLLFYSPVIRDSGRMARAGASLHHLDSNAIFFNMLEFILSYKNDPHYESLCSYFYGFVCHYALDSTVHPYVYYLMNKLDGQMSTSRHAQIETEVASLMYRRMTGMPISSFKIYEHYTSKGEFIEPVAKMYVYLIDTLLDKKVSEDMVKSGLSYCLFLNYFTYLFASQKLSNALRTAILKVFKLFVRQSDFLCSFIKNDNVENDTLNLMHDKWYNLRNPYVTYSYSMPELFEFAKATAVNISQRCYNMLSAGEIVPLGLTENFDSGMPEKKEEKWREKINRRQIIKSRT